MITTAVCHSSHDFVTEPRQCCSGTAVGPIARRQEARLPVQEFGGKERGCLFKGYTDLE